VGYALYLLVDSGSLSLTVPSPVRIGRIWDVTLWICVAVMAVGVNVALYLWSRFCRSNREKVDHKGVAEMVETAQGRDLTASEHAYYTFMALANAICEEISSRGLWRWYYRHIFWQEDSSSSPWASNMAQALVGLWFVALLWNPQWMDWSFPHHNLRSFIGISRRLCRRRLIFTHSGAHDCRLLYFCHCCQAEEETFKGLMRVRGGRQTVQRLCALFTYTTHVKWRRHQSKKEQISATKCQLYSQAQLFSSTPDIVAANLGSGIE